MTDTGQAPMSYDDWVETYSPVFTDDGSLVQYPTWTELPNGVDLRTAWAVIEGDDEDPHEEDCDCDPPAWVIMPGYHLVNVLYFTLTRIPCTDDSFEYVLWD